MKIVFLSLDEILRLHQDLINLYGGSHGMRNQDLLELALAQPEAGFGDQYLCADIFEMAAAYLFHLVQNHPFHDGNKRIGAQSAIVFLGLNDIELKVECESKFEKLVMRVASSQAEKPEIAEFFRQNSTKS